MISLGTLTQLRQYLTVIDTISTGLQLFFEGTQQGLDLTDTKFSSMIREGGWQLENGNTLLECTYRGVACNSQVILSCLHPNFCFCDSHCIFIGRRSFSNEFYDTFPVPLDHHSEHAREISISIWFQNVPLFSLCGLSEREILLSGFIC